MSEVMRKRPDEVLDYVFDFAKWLSEGDSITDATATVTGNATIDSTQANNTVATVWVSGGDAGETVEVTVTITTTGGRTKEATMKLRIEG
jgi:hypothetical protein